MKAGWMIILLISLVISCATFKGEIPVATEFPEAFYISPMNGDGIKDEVSIPLSIPEIKGMKIAGFRIGVVSETGREIYVSQSEEQGKKRLFGRKASIAIPSEIQWDGRDSAGEWADDGVYFLSVEVWDYSENHGTSPQIQVIVDNTPPQAEISVPFSVFSPNNDKNQDLLPIYHHNSSAEDTWTGAIRDSKGKNVCTRNWAGIPETFSWDGLDDSGNSIPDGEYHYVLSSTDLAGNSFTSELSGIVVDRTVHPVSISVSTPAFSPNGDGIKDTVDFSIILERREQISSVRLWVVDSKGQERGRIDSVGSHSETAVFNGLDTEGMLLPEGDYYGILQVLYLNGDAPTVRTDTFVLDTTPPYAVIRLDTPVFSPDGDGKKDSVSIFQSTSIEPAWQGKILDANRQVRRDHSWTNRAVAFNWDGKDGGGRLLPDGVYTYELSAEDSAGNRSAFSLPGIRIDTRPTPVRLTPSNLIFSPNSDGLNDVIEFECVPEIKDGIEGWKFSVLNEAGDAVLEYNHPDTQSVNETVVWDGRNRDGKIIEGLYAARLEVAYAKGNLADAVSDSRFVLDITPPSVEITTSPDLFSPDGDGENDLCTIVVKPADSGGVKSWSAQILDPAGSLFLALKSSDFSRNTYQWRGTSSSGELVQSASDYTLSVTAEDTVGNVSVTAHTIPIDILVLKEGDRLRISISSIYFKPYTADYLSVDPQIRERNLATIERLGVILNKFSGYRILLEGHAVRVYWNDPKKWLTEENEVLLPLSKERAEAIRDALIRQHVSAERMSTDGAGGYHPVVPHSDLQNRWKNRRVEFYLIRK